jgi:hypothetical protein
MFDIQNNVIAKLNSITEDKFPKCFQSCDKRIPSLGEYFEGNGQ